MSDQFTTHQDLVAQGGLDALSRVRPISTEFTFSISFFACLKVVRALSKKHLTASVNHSSSV